MKKMIVLLLLGACVLAQNSAPTNEYLLGSEKKLEMIVHIWGEVRSPGEYRVEYNTNLVELMSFAGGPSKTANLKKVRLTRAARTDSTAGLNQDKEIIHFNIQKYLKDADALTAPPVLRPGDVVYIRNNSFHWARETIRVMYEIALVASVAAWHIRR